MEKIEKLLALLMQSDGPVKRQFLLDVRGKVKPRKNKARTTSEPAVTTQTGTAIPGVTSSLGEAQISALLVDLRGSRDADRLAKDYVNGGEPLSLRLGQKMASGSILVVIAQVIDLPRISSKLSYWNYKAFDHIFLNTPPETPEVTRAIAIAACSGTETSLFDSLRKWQDGAVAVERCRELLANRPGRKVHLFAKEMSPGWETVIGEENYQLPSQKS